MITALYISSSLIGSNPSVIGGTYAWRLVHDDREPAGTSAIVPMMVTGQEITNNQAEMLALIKGLEQLPADFRGQICSASQVTLDRAFNGCNWSNIPGWMHRLYQVQRKRLVCWSDIQVLRVDVKNEHIKWCKQECRESADAYLTRIGANIPTIGAAEIGR
jgi:ribonuclease HI